MQNYSGSRFGAFLTYNSPEFDEISREALNVSTFKPTYYSGLDGSISLDGQMPGNASGHIPGMNRRGFPFLPV